MNANAKKLEATLKKKYGNAYRKTKGKNGLEYKICCPFCHRRKGTEDKRFKMYLNPELDRCHCFRCEYRGTVSGIFKNIQLSANNPFKIAKIEALPTNGIMPGSLHRLSELSEDHVALAYLRSRGFDPYVCEEFYGVKYCSEGQRFSNIFDTSNTIIFPLWMSGELVGWQSRLLYNPEKLTDVECNALGYNIDDNGKYIRPPKYYTSPGLDKGRILFNYDMARKSDVVVITEGPTDCMAAGPCAVATLGKGVTDQQANLIKAYWKLAVVLLDPGDADAQMSQLVNSIRTAIPAIKVSLHNYDDPGDAPTVEIWSQIYTEAEKGGIDLSQYNLGPNMTKKAFKL